MNHLAMTWKGANNPRIEELQGRFRVDILSGPFKTMAPFVKTWEKEITKAWGHNIINDKVTGRFTLVRTIGDNPLLYLDYDSAQKPAYWSRMKDEIRLVESKVFLGKIWMMIWGKYRFMGYFSLTRLELVSPADVLLIAAWRVSDYAALFAFLIKRWEFTETSMVNTAGRHISLATGGVPKNEALVKALKKNVSIWQWKTLSVDNYGFYKFCFPLNDEATPC